MAAEAAVSFAVETLGKLLIEKAVFLKGVRGEVEWLRDKLKSMQCFLQDATKKQTDSESIRNWISDIRKVAHDAEDAIEMFALHVQSRGRLASYTCCFNHLSHLNKIGKQIDSIKKKLKDIEDSRRDLKIEDLGDHQEVESSARTTLQQKVEARRNLASWRNDEQVVGLEKDVDDLLTKWVKSEGFTVAAILGMGGMGKSTLANKIYNHHHVAKDFEFRAWAVVSSEFTPENIMKHLLSKLGVTHDGIQDLQSLQNLKEELYRLLTGKRYFIVLDDVWSTVHWESLRTAFPNEGNGSRLLLTSRNANIITKSSGYVHDMKILEADQSWDLFLIKVFSHNNNIDDCPELKSIGEEILKKCGGLPLAISVVGGLLAKRKRSEIEWNKVLQEMKHHVDGRGELDVISAVLELSYQNLPPELKACFLCLGFFQEDAIIKAEHLVHIWVAHGLVRQEVVREGETMEDLAREYLNELIGLNMVLVNKISLKDDRVKSCYVDDRVRDLSIRKAKEEIDLEVVREEGNSFQSSDKPRHRAIYCKDASFLYSTKLNMRYIRSLFIIEVGNRYAGYDDGASSYWKSFNHLGILDFGTVLPNDDGASSYWKSFDLLRILDFGTVLVQVLPESIGLVTGLRYIRIRCHYRTFKVPRSWAKLKNLEILDLRSDYAYSFITIEKELIMMMDSLRHVYADGLTIEGFGGGHMSNLETVSMLTVDNKNLRQIEALTRVSKLGIHVRTNTSTLCSYLSMLQNLVSLTLQYNASPENIKGLAALHHVTRLQLNGPYNQTWLPEEFPPNLSCLILKGMDLRKDSILILERLPKLLYLKMDNAYEHQEIVMSPGAFPKLKVLCVSSLSNLTNIEVKEGAIPELHKFIIRYCYKLEIENLPERLKSAITHEDQSARD